MSLTPADRWVVMKSFFTSKGLVRQHLDSYNDFLENRLQEIVSDVAKIEPDIPNYYVRLGRVEIQEPSVREADGSVRTIYPAEARVRNLTYSAPINLEMTPVYRDEKTGMEYDEETTSVYVGRMPIMLKSGFCRLSSMTQEELIEAGEDPNDPGGYFIINGSERVLVTQEDLAPNRILIEEATSSSSCTHMAKVFSTARGFRAPVTMERRADHTFRVSFPSVPGKIPLVVLMRALGLVTDREMVGAITDDAALAQELIPSFHAAESLVVPNDPQATRENALDYIGKRVAVGQTKDYRLRRAEQVLNRYLLPHIGTDPGSALSKAYYLGQMTQQLIELAVNRRAADDKDHYANKRLKLAGDLLTSLFRVAFLNLCRDIKYQLERTATRGRKPNIKTAVRADVITERLRHALATGNWVGGKAGVSQLLDRVNYMSSISHLRRVVSPLSRSQPHFEARDLHPTHWGKICPAETPEGPNCVVPQTLVALAGGGACCMASLDDDMRWRSSRLMSATWHVLGRPRVDAVYPQVARFIKNEAKERRLKLHHIKTEKNREIFATADHPFYTDQGRLDAKFLRPGMKVAVLPAALERPDWGSQVTNDEVVLDEQSFLAACPPFSDRQLHIESLRRMGFIPLRKSDSRYQILLRLLGYMFGDGHLAFRIREGSSGKPKSDVAVHFTGRPNDLSDIRDDVAMLGFRSSEIRTAEAISVLSDRTIRGSTSHTVCYQKPFWILMKALGAPVGNKPLQMFSVPEWLHTSSDAEVREFLAAFFGCEMSKPLVDKRTGKVFTAPSIKMSKELSKTDSLRIFLSEIMSLTKRFHIGFPEKAIVPKEFFSRKDGATTRKLQLNFSGSMENLVKLWGQIGYTYNRKRESLAQRAYAYLKAHLDALVERQTVAEYVAGRHRVMRGTPTQKARALMEELGFPGNTKSIRLHDIVNWIKTNTDPPQARVSELDMPTFEEWVSSASSGLDGSAGLVWETIKMAKVDNSGNHRIVEDVTMADANHNFFANGFLTGNCGLVKNLALMAYISVGSDEAEVEEALLSLKVTPLSGVPVDERKGAYIYLNGRFVGTHSQPELLVARLRDRRQRGELSDQVNLAYHSDTHEVQINSDAGRVRRSLIVVKDGALLLDKQHVERVRNREVSWEDMIKAGVIEYLDAEEEENTLIAMNPEELTPEHTHMELVPEAILGICASLVPFAEHNQSPRNTYEAGMAKQALGLFCANFGLRVDTRSHLLHYVQSPIVTTRPMEVIGFDRRPAGQNFVVAIHSFEGYNIEDALVMNKASVERGVGRSTFFRCYDAEERKYPGGQEDKFEIPSREVRGYRASEAYRLLSEDGIIEPEFQVGGDEIVIGRTSPPRFLEEYTELEVPGPKRRETSTSLRHGEEGTIDKVLVTETIDGNRLVKVKVRDERIPELGDKFASRHGQKGVIGLLAPQEDMPFTESGVVPDLVVNAHAFPSRMTLGQILESIGGKIGSLKGKQIDGTPFSGTKAEEMFHELHDLGFKYSGRETMYNGITGRKYDVDLFIGVVYYQKLHHLVADKMHARARGPVQILTRQPTEGRAREGGLRFGEMERDCLIGHGAALLLRERLLDESDKYTAMVCEECGMLAEYDRNRDRYRCRVCAPRTTTISKVTISYAFKLVVQELMSLGIWPRLKLAERT